MLQLTDHLIASFGPRVAESFWFPTQASSSAAQTDWLFNFIMIICVVFMALIVFLLGMFIWLYRSKGGRKPEPTAMHHTGLELTWTIIPAILCVFIFYFGISGYLDLRRPPLNANEVVVIGQKWYWSFTYPNGVVDSELHVAKGQATRLVMQSEDVIHSFFVPAFRVKLDVVPGRINKMWFTPTEVGTHQVFCTEYCGEKHSAMLTKVIVHEPEDFERWMATSKEKNNNKDPAALGQELWAARGCQQCHSVDGSRVIGPTFKGLFGRHEEFADGGSVTADENYIRESILQPQAKVVAGYPPIMPTYQGKLSDTEINGIIAYIKTLK